MKWFFCLVFLLLPPLEFKETFNKPRQPASQEQSSCIELANFFFPSNKAADLRHSFKDKSQETSADLIWTYYIELILPKSKKKSMGMPTKFSEYSALNQKVLINGIPFFNLGDDFFYHSKSKLPYIINEAGELEEIPSSLMLIYNRMRSRNSTSFLSFQNELKVRNKDLPKISKINFHPLEGKNSYFPQNSFDSKDKKILENLINLKPEEIKKLIIKGDYKEAEESNFTAIYNRALRLLSEFDFYEKSFNSTEEGFRIVERVKREIFNTLEEQLQQVPPDKKEHDIFELIRNHLEDLKSGKRLLFIGGPENLITETGIYSHASRGSDRTNGLTFWQVMAQKAHSGFNNRYLSLSSDINIAQKFAMPKMGSSQTEGTIAVVLVDKERTTYNFFNDMWGFQEWEHVILDKIGPDEIIEVRKVSK